MHLNDRRRRQACQKMCSTSNTGSSVDTGAAGSIAEPPAEHLEFTEVRE